MSDQLETRFAPAERVTQSVLDDECRCIETIFLLKQMIDNIPSAVMVLNGYRQIVNVNQVLLDMLGVEHKVLLCGRRPGEVLSCIHASNETGGCGTTEFCRLCGAVNAILASQNGVKTIRECSITREGYTDALEFRVLAAPFNVEGQDFTIFSLENIVHEKRRRLLERIFFHDILNFAASLRGLSQILKEAPPDQMEEFHDIIYKVSDQLVEEINAQRDLTAAENNEYVPTLTPLNSVRILEEVMNVYKRHEVAAERNIQIDSCAHEVTLVSDKTLLRRIIGNMIKNALETSRPGETVTLGCSATGCVRFWVHNPGSMPRDVQLQVFKRSFSTKGKGRGLGTYSMKLFGERYLGGSVDFASSPEKGTIFSVSIPLLPEERKVDTSAHRERTNLLNTR